MCVFYIMGCVITIGYVYTVHVLLARELNQRSSAAQQNGPLLDTKDA